MALLEVPLMRQERRALHEKHREGRHADVGHRDRSCSTPRRLSGNPAKQPRNDPSRNSSRRTPPGIPFSRSCESPILMLERRSPRMLLPDSPPPPRAQLNRIENCWPKRLKLEEPPTQGYTDGEREACCGARLVDECGQKVSVFEVAFWSEGRMTAHIPTRQAACAGGAACSGHRRRNRHWSSGGGATRSGARYRSRTARGPPA